MDTTTDPTPDRLMSTNDAAATLGAPVRTVQYWIKTGRLPYAVKLPGGPGVYVLNEADVHQFKANLDARRTR